MSSYGKKNGIDSRVRNKAGRPRTKNKAVSVHTTIDQGRFKRAEASGLPFSHFLGIGIDVVLGGIENLDKIKLMEKSKELELELNRVKGELEYRNTLESNQRLLRIQVLKNKIKAGLILEKIIQTDQMAKRITMRPDSITDIYGVTFDFDDLNRSMADPRTVRGLLDMDKEDLADKFHAKLIRETLKNAVFDNTTVQIYHGKYGFDDVSIEGESQ